MKRPNSIMLLILTCFLGGCKHDQNPTALMERPVQIRPIVSINSVIDHARHDLPWDVSQELTRAIRLRLTQQNSLYLLSEHQVSAMAQKLTDKRDPFGDNSEMTWLKKVYPQNEFVAFLELIDHQETPLSAAENSPAELTIAMKVHVFDLRQQQPRVVLQEIVRQSHHIPMQFTQGRDHQLPWENEMFEISPLGLAHEKLCQEVAVRIEDYILLSCTKP